MSHRKKLPNYYHILGVQNTATEQEIRQAYRQLAKRHHPDLNPDVPYADEVFSRINEAYAVLSDDDKKREYDVRVSLREQKQQYEQEARGFNAETGNFAPNTETARDIFTIFEQLKVDYKKPHLWIPWRTLPVEHYVVIAFMALLVFVGLPVVKGRLATIADVIIFVIYVLYSSRWVVRFRAYSNSLLFFEIVVSHVISIVIAFIVSIPLLFFMLALRLVRG